MAITMVGAIDGMNTVLYNQYQILQWQCYSMEVRQHWLRLKTWMVTVQVRICQSGVLVLD
jgi:hypothetical protein